jgi:hypothetical protein
MPPAFLLKPFLLPPSFLRNRAEKRKNKMRLKGKNKTAAERKKTKNE